MANINTLVVVEREHGGKGPARAIRRQGLVPGVVYGNKQPARTVAIEPRLLAAEMNKPGFGTRLFTLQTGEASELCLCRDVQRDPVSDKPLHVDFLRVAPDSKIHVRVPLHVVGQAQSPGLKRGGVLNMVAHEIEMICAAGAIPTAIEIDVGGLDIGASVHLHSVALPEGATLVTHEKDATLATIVAPTVQAAQDQAPAADAAAAPAATSEAS